MVLICTSLMINNPEHLFVRIFVISIYFLVKYLFVWGFFCYFIGFILLSFGVIYIDLFLNFLTKTTCFGGIFFNILFIYFEREGKWGRKRGRETLICCLLHMFGLGPNPHPRHVPWPETEPATFRFTGWHPDNWATWVRAQVLEFSFSVYVN